MDSASDPANHPPVDRSATEALTRNAGRYLVAMHWLAGDDDRRVGTGELGTYLGVESASVTEMFEKLDSLGFVEYEPYEGGVLTDAGEDLATRLAFRECVVRAFFGGEVDVGLDDDTAYRIGFTLPETGIRRLAELVDHPCVDACRSSPQSVEYCRV